MSCAAGGDDDPGLAAEGFDWLRPRAAETAAVRDIGGDNVPVVVADRMDLAAGGRLKPTSARIPTSVPTTCIAGAGFRPPPTARRARPTSWMPTCGRAEGTFPAFPPDMLPFVGGLRAGLKFLFLTYGGADGGGACLPAPASRGGGHLPKRTPEPFWANTVRSSTS